MKGFINFLYAPTQPNSFPNLSTVHCDVILTVDGVGTGTVSVDEAVDPFTGTKSHVQVVSPGFSALSTASNSTWNVSIVSTKTSRSETWTSPIGSATINYTGTEFNTAALAEDTRNLCLATEYPDAVAMQNFTTREVYSREIGRAHV